MPKKPLKFSFRQSCVLSTDRIKIHQSQPASISKEGLKVTLVAVIGGFRSYLSITRVQDWWFPQVFSFPKSRINENGGNQIRQYKNPKKKHLHLFTTKF